MAESSADRLSRLRIDRTRRLPGTRVKRRLLPAIAALLVLALIFVALAARAPAVQVAEVREARPGEAYTDISASGYVASRRRSIIAPQIPGRLLEILVEEGQPVQQGDVIARLDPSDAEVALQQARAGQDTAEARLHAAEAALIKAKRDLERARALARSNAISVAGVQDAATNRNAAQAELNAAKSGVAAAEEVVSAAQLQLDHTVVRAPFTGTVVRKIAGEGAVLAPAAISEAEVGGIVEMVDLQALEVEAEVSEEQLGRLKEGQPALVFLDAFPDRVYRAHAGTVRPAIDKAKATAVVKVEFDSPPEGALPDMGAKVSFLNRPVDDQMLREGPRLRVPATAVVERNGGPVVFVLENGRARAVPVQTAERLGDEIALVKGPAPGTSVVASPTSRLRDGARVKVKEAS